MYKEKIITLVGEALKEAKEEMVSRVKNITTDISFTLCKMSETECAIVAQVDKLCVVDKAYSKYFAPCLGFKDLHQRRGSLPSHPSLSPLQPGPEPSVDSVSLLVLFSC